MPSTLQPPPIRSQVLEGSPNFFTQPWSVWFQSLRQVTNDFSTGGAYINVTVYGASSQLPTDQNKAKLQYAISQVEDLGSGTLFIPQGVNYGYDRTDPSTWPDFTGVGTDMVIEDYSTGNSYTAPARDGAQYRKWMFTHDATAGNTDGNTSWIRGNWAPALVISNDSQVANPSVNAYDNRRATVFFQNDGVTTWGIGQGTITGAGNTPDQLSTFTIKANGLSGIGVPGLTNVFEISKLNGSFAFNTSPDTYAGAFVARSGVDASFAFIGTGSDPGLLLKNGSNLSRLLLIANGGIRLDGEVHGINTCYFQTSDSTTQTTLIRAGVGSLGSVNLFTLGDRATVSSSGSTTGGSFDTFRVSNSKSNKILNVEFDDSPALIKIGTTGVSGSITWSDTTQSTSTTTGSQIFKGGVAFQKDVFGVNATFSGTVTAGTISTAGAAFTALVSITVAGSNAQLQLNRTGSSAGTVNLFANAAGTGSTDTFNVTDTSNANIFRATVTGMTVAGALTAGITTAPSFATSGTGGLGFLDYNAQSAAPSTPASNHIRVYSDATGRMAWIRSDGFVRTFASTLTADRVWTWPDVAGTIVTTGNLTDITATGTVASGTWNGTKIGLAYGGTNLDMTATGGSNQFLKQSSLGGAITVTGIVSADLATALTTPPVIGGTTAAGATFTGGSSFTLQDPGDATKQAHFLISSIATGTTRNYSFANANYTVAGINLSQNWTGTQTFTTPVPFTDATDATSSTTGAVKVTGGLSAQKTIFAGTGVLSSSPTAGSGYATGAGGTVTQSTNKSTGVTLSKVCGAITMNNAALASDTVVSFTLTNTAIAATDVLVLNHISGGTAGAYALNAQAAAGSASINVYNHTAGSLSEAIVIQFVVIKGVNA